MILKLYNTLSRKKEEFKPLNPPLVTFYSCGPTVYDYTHIGHLRTYTNNDILKRTLLFLGYEVKHVMNITDVGHLTGDDDTGEDKIEKKAKDKRKNVWEIAQYYTQYFFDSIKKLNILSADINCRATDHIKEMIDLIEKLQSLGFTYETKTAVYFNVLKFKNYGKLSGQKIEEKIQRAREEVYVDKEKKHPADFALWFKCVGRFAHHIMRWSSPWGEGFPGWHIECSAMSMRYLGETIDIHSGGVDHIPIHHENEIAQSEALTGKIFVRFWFHNNFLKVNNQKMSKSLKNFYTIDDLVKKGIHPLALRYFYLSAHYRQILNFTWEAINSAQESYFKLKEKISRLYKEGKKELFLKKDLLQKNEFKKEFISAISDDLNTPRALALVWEMIKSNLPSSIKLDLINDFDKILGLKLILIEEEKIPEEIYQLALKRQKFRLKGDFKLADELRKKIEKLGYQIEDLKDNEFRIKKNKVFRG